MNDKANPLGLDDDFLGRNFECGCRMTIIANTIKIHDESHDQLSFNFCEDHLDDEVLQVHRILLQMVAAGGSLHSA